MTVEVLGKTLARATVEALIEVMIAALDTADGDENNEASEVDEDDLRAFPKELPDGWSDDSEED